MIFLWLNVTFYLSAFAENPIVPIEQDSIFKLAFSKHQFLYLDDPTVNADGKWIAYTVKERKDSPREFQGFLPDGTPLPMIGCRIYLSNQDSKRTVSIAPNNADSWRPVFSPNGNQLAFYSNASGQCTLWIYDLSSGLSNQLSELPINTSIFSEDKPIWNPEGTEIYVPLALSTNLQSKVSFYKMKTELPQKNKNGAIVKVFRTEENHQTDEVANKGQKLDWISGSLAAIDVVKGSFREIVPNQTNYSPAYMKLSSTGKWLAHSTSINAVDDPSKIGFNLVIRGARNNNEVATLVDGLTTDGYTQSWIWHPKEDILFYEKDKKIHFVELDNKGVKRKGSFFEENNIQLMNEPLLLTQDGNSLIVGGKPYPVGYSQAPASLFIIPLNENKEPVEIQIKAPWKYISVISTTESQAWQPQQDEISLILEKVDTGETAIVNLNITHSVDADQGEFIWQRLAKLKSYPVKGNPDINYWMYEDLTTPQNIYLTRSGFSDFSRISDIEPNLDQLTPPLKKVFETYISNYEGRVEVRTTVLLPENYDPKNPPPGIVLFYPGSLMSNCVKAFGGGDVVTIPSFIFLNQGYALIFPDIPLKPDGKASHRIQEIVNALLPQVQYAINLNYVDPKRLGLMGHSYGGYSTAGVITQTQLFQAAVASSGVYDLAGLYGQFDSHQQFPNFAMQWAEHGQGGMGMPPWDNLQHYFENSPYYLADRIHTPLLLIHGEDDIACPVTEAQKMFTALKRLNRKAELAIYPGEGHVMDEWTLENALDGTMRVITFFNNHLLNQDLDSN